MRQGRQGWQSSWSQENRQVVVELAKEMCLVTAVNGLLSRVLSCFVSLLYSPMATVVSTFADWKFAIF